MPDAPIEPVEPIESTGPVDIEALLATQAGRRRGRLIAAAVVGLLVIALLGWWFLGRSPAKPASTVQTATVTRGSIAAVLSTSGSANAALQTKLTFNASGATTVTGVVATVDVKVGDRVTAGQRLATLDRRNVTRALQQAQARVESERIRLQQLGVALPQDVATAAQAVASAQATWQKALNDLAALRNSPTFTQDVATARQTLILAQSSLASAQQALDLLQGRLDASAQVTTLQQRADALRAQQSAATAEIQALAERTANPALAPAATTFAAAATSLCSRPGNREPCLTAASGATSLDGLVTALAAVAGPPSITAARAEFEGALGLSASDAVRDAAFRLVQAAASLPGLQERINALSLSLSNPGVPSADAMASARATRDAAQAAVTAAQAKLDRLVAGATEPDLQNAQNTVAAAEAALNAARAKQAGLGGTENLNYQLQQQQVQLAEIAAQQAQDAVDDTTLKAPFAGVIGAVAINPGDLVSPSAPAITLTDPDRITVQLVVSEADLPGLAVGQCGIATFDALPGRTYVVQTTGVSNIPTVTQGVVTYQAQADILGGDVLRAQRGRLGDLYRTRGVLPPGASDADVQALTDRLAAQPLPAPGMNAAIAIVEQVVPNALIVPSAAVRKQGQQNVVFVQAADGTTQRVPVTVGVSDGTNTAITSGVKEGDRVVTSGLTATATGTGTTAAGGGGAPPFGPR